MPVEINHDMEVKDLIRENLELTREIHTMTKKIKGHITFQKVVSFIYLVIIIAPIILGFIFLPPFLKDIVGQYQELLGPSAPGGLLNTILNTSPSSTKTQNTATNTMTIDLNKVPPDLLKYLPKK